MSDKTHTVYLDLEYAQGVSFELIRVGVPFRYELKVEGFRIHRHTVTVHDSRTELLNRIVAIVKLRRSR